jgi:hypothetical protein
MMRIELATDGGFCPTPPGRLPGFGGWSSLCERVGPIIVTKSDCSHSWAGQNDWEIIMARPLRIEYAGAVYHVMARGNHKGVGS